MQFCETDHWTLRERGASLVGIIAQQTTLASKIGAEIERRSLPTWNNIKKREKENHPFYVKGEPVPLADLVVEQKQRLRNAEWADDMLVDVVRNLLEGAWKLDAEGEALRRNKEQEKFSAIHMEANIRRLTASELDSEKAAKIWAVKHR